VLIIKSPSFHNDFFKSKQLALWPFQGQSLPSHEAANGSATAGLPVFFPVLRWGDFFWFHISERWLIMVNSGLMVVNSG